MVSYKNISKFFFVMKISQICIIDWNTSFIYPYLKWQWIFDFLRRCFFPLSLPRLLPDCIWVTRQMSYKKQELLREHLSSPPGFGGVRVHLFNFCVVLLCVFTFWVPCDLCCLRIVVTQHILLYLTNFSLA